jgi:membrane associated rhomboid family serine protease
MLACFVLCFMNLFGQVANVVHAGGLASGMLLGLVPGKRP